MILRANFDFFENVYVCRQLSNDGQQNSRYSIIIKRLQFKTRKSE